MLNFEFLVKDLFLHHILCITFGGKYYFDVTFAAEVLIVIISCWRSPKTIQAVHPHTHKKKKKKKKKKNVSFMGCIQTRKQPWQVLDCRVMFVVNILIIKKLPCFFFFFFLFFNCYLAAPQPTLGHFRGDSFNKLILNTAFSAILTRRSPGAS